MPGSLHQRILALIAARPEIMLTLWAIVEPEFVELLGRGWIARVTDSNLRVRGFAGDEDRHRLGDLVITLHPADDPDSDPQFVLVVECQINPDLKKFYVWPEYLIAARTRHRAPGRLFVLSPVDSVIAWAAGLFPLEPKMEVLLLGREHLPVINDPRRALREPELAVLSAVFHGPHEGGHEVLAAAGVALRSLPPNKQEDYGMLLEDAFPEDMMDEVRKITLQEAQASADEWMRTRGPYVIGHREGLEEGRSAGLEEGRSAGLEEGRSAGLEEGRSAGLEEGRSAGLEQGLLQGRRDAIAVVLEVRGLTPTAAEQARVDACTDRGTLERWCEQAKTAVTVEELFAGI